MKYSITALGLIRTKSKIELLDSWPTQRTKLKKNTSSFNICVAESKAVKGRKKEIM